MSERMKGKLRDNSGETIAETLIALLISALALMMLAGAIAATSRLIERSEKRLNAYYANNNLMVAHTPDADAADTEYVVTGPKAVSIAEGSDGTGKKMWLAKKNESEGLESDNVTCYQNATLSGGPVVVYVPVAGG